MLSFIQNQILSLASFKESVQIAIPHNKAIVPATFSATEIGSFVFLSDLPELLLHKILLLGLSGIGEERYKVARATGSGVVSCTIILITFSYH